MFQGCRRGKRMPSKSVRSRHLHILADTCDRMEVSSASKWTRYPFITMEMNIIFLYMPFWPGSFQENQRNLWPPHRRSSTENSCNHCNRNNLHTRLFLPLGRWRICPRSARHINGSTTNYRWENKPGQWILSLEEKAEYRRGITASFGLSVFPQHGTVQQDLILNADVAMFQAKSSDRNCVVAASLAEKLTFQLYFQEFKAKKRPVKIRAV